MSVAHVNTSGTFPVGLAFTSSLCSCVFWMRPWRSGLCQMLIPSTQILILYLVYQDNRQKQLSLSWASFPASLKLTFQKLHQKTKIKSVMPCTWQTAIGEGDPPGEDTFLWCQALRRQIRIKASWDGGNRTWLPWAGKSVMTVVVWLRMLWGEKTSGGLPWWLSGKASTCWSRGHGFVPDPGRSLTSQGS